MILCFLILLHVITLVAGNTEKVIFKGPAQVHVPDVTPNLGNLKLQQLSPSSNVVRTQLQRAFPTKLESKGTQSWFLLDGLDHGVRYEVRICWAAIQPTEFWLITHQVDDVFEDPELIIGLATYSESLQKPKAAPKILQDRRLSSQLGLKSVLFLQVFSAADYFTLNETLMSFPPPVDVDISGFLDPYVLNIFPQSLVPTAYYIILLAIGSYLLSAYIWRWLVEISRVQKSHEE